MALSLPLFISAIHSYSNLIIVCVFKYDHMSENTGNNEQTSNRESFLSDLVIQEKAAKKHMD